jgi:hypothetical protein
MQKSSLVKVPFLCRYESLRDFWFFVWENHILLAYWRCRSQCGWCLEYYTKGHLERWNWIDSNCFPATEYNLLMLCCTYKLHIHRLIPLWFPDMTGLKIYKPFDESHVFCSKFQTIHSVFPVLKIDPNLKSVEMLW